MLRIKRVKQGPPTVTAVEGKRVEVPGVITTRYATAVSSKGVVEGWSSSASEAVPVTDGIARRVREFYAGKSNVGELTFETVSATASQLANAVSAEDAIGAAEFAALQEECKRLASENAKLEVERDEAKEAHDQSRKRIDALTIRIGSLEMDVTARSERAATLAAKVADLEAAAKAAKDVPLEPIKETNSTQQPQPHKAKGK